MKSENRKYVMIGITLAGVYLFISYWDMLAELLLRGGQAARPLLLGAVIAYVVNILMQVYEEKVFARAEHLKKSKRLLSVLMAFISIIVILFCIVYLILPELISCIQTLIQQVPGALEQLNLNWYLDQLLQNSGMELNLEEKFMSEIQNIAAGLSSLMGNIVIWISSFASMILMTFTALIFSIYLLFGKEKIGGQLRKVANLYLNPRWTKKISYVLSTLNNSFHKFIVGQVTEAVILGTLCILGMSLLRLPYAMMVGTFIGFTALIPVVGAYLGAVVGFVMIVTESPIKALIFLVFIAVLQQLEGNLIYPKVVGSSIGLPGIWVFAAVMIGGGVLGIPGMLLGVPLTAAVYQMIRDDSARREKAGQTVEGITDRK
ncbi:MAG: AI-2E family transporter [Lachnospiraceae bacterium]|nr:AI-2E family transporter [Lachnospiraceae bacterium]